MSKSKSISKLYSSIILSLVSLSISIKLLTSKNSLILLLNSCINFSESSTFTISDLGDSGSSISSSSILNEYSKFWLNFFKLFFNIHNSLFLKNI